MIGRGDRGGRGSGGRGRGGPRGRGRGQYATQSRPYNRGNHNSSGDRDQDDLSNPKPPKVATLEALLSKQPHELLLESTSPRSALLGALRASQMLSPRHLCPLLHLLARVATCPHSTELLVRFLASSLDTAFFRDRLHCVVSSEITQQVLQGYWNADEARSCLLDLIIVLQACYTHVTSAAYDRLHLVVLGLQSVIESLSHCVDVPCIVDNTLLTLMKELLEQDKRAILTKVATRPTKKHRPSADDDPPDNFRDYPIAPTPEELKKTNTDVFLRRNVVEGKYRSVDDYLDVQFRLMREDFVAPLRDGIAEFLGQRDASKKPSSDTFIYHGVRILHPVCLRVGIGHVLRLDFAKNPKLKKTKWDRSKRLMFGSLLCLFTADFKDVLFATVADRDTNALTLSGDIKVKFLNTEVAVDDLGRVYTMAESSAYFEAYRHVLVRLQQFNAKTLPLAEHITACQVDVKPPRYLLEDAHLVFDFNCILNNYARPKFSGVDPLRAGAWPSARELGFDDSQYKALRNAVMRRLVLVQGPPGTGKTFIGLKIARLLLQNVVTSVPSFGPMLVVCYTNHALDQFVEGIASFPIPFKMVRVGGRSQSEVMKKYNLVNARQDFIRRRQISHDIRREIVRARVEVEDLTDELNAKMVRMKASHDYVLTFQALEPFVLPKHLKQLSASQANNKCNMKKWLFGLNTTEVAVERMNDAALVSICQGLVTETVDELVDEICRDELILALDEGVEEEGQEVEDEVAFILRNRLLDVDIEDEEDAKEKMARSQQRRQKQLQNLIGNEVVDLEEEEEEANAETESDAWQDVGVKGRDARRIARTQLKREDFMTEKEEEGIGEVWELNLGQKWSLYRLWRHRYYAALDNEIAADQKKFDAASQRHRELLDLSDREVLAAHDVIAMTTSGAARYGDMLSVIGPKIVMVEEAAEVFESHIIGSLSSSCQHLILIGDHQQLRPSPAVYNLATRFQLDISLFERLIHNGFKHDTLTQQHRMRAEISRLLQHDKLYPALQNHDSVLQYPSLVGLTHNVFFLDHTNKENGDAVDQVSYKNTFEARFAVSLCEHFFKLGYKASQITILTLYSSQLYEIKRILRGKSYPGLTVTVVDNYQGEENHIVILSLVRSNDAGRIGFVGVDNRICVSLSRAKWGLFVLGNFALFRRKSDLWATIANLVETQNQLGPGLPLKCRHKDVFETIRNPEDFQKLSPEGGCRLDCREPLKCGHLCPRKCHPSDHSNFTCRQTCGKLCAREKHFCTKRCNQACGECQVEVTMKLPCAHVKSVKCHAALGPLVCDKKLDCGHFCRDTVRNVCVQTVKATLTSCGHEIVKKCSDDIGAVMCPEPCKGVMACGNHRCMKKCCLCILGDRHKDTKCEKPMSCGHRCCDIVDGVCSVMVKARMPNCMHLVEKKCGQSISEVECTSVCDQWMSCKRHQCKNDCRACPITNHARIPCSYPCGRFCNRATHVCLKKCSERCGKCEIVIEVFLLCKHTHFLKCHLAETFLCDIVMPCGHQCHKAVRGICSVVLSEVRPQCGHLVNRKCGIAMENVSCPELVIIQSSKCQHISTVKCGTKPEEIDCKKICGRRLSCQAHDCEAICGVCYRTQSDHKCTRFFCRLFRS